MRLLKAKDIKDVANGDSLLGELQKARERTFSLLDKAEAAADTRVYGSPVAYLKEIREQIKLLAELEGRLASQPQINLLVLPEWIELKTKIVAALRPYPEALESRQKCSQMISWQPWTGRFHKGRPGSVGRRLRTPQRQGRQYLLPGRQPEADIRPKE